MREKFFSENQEIETFEIIFFSLQIDVTLFQIMHRAELTHTHYT